MSENLAKKLIELERRVLLLEKLAIARGDSTVPVIVSPSPEPSRAKDDGDGKAQRLPSRPRQLSLRAPKRKGRSIHHDDHVWKFGQAMRARMKEQDVSIAEVAEVIGCSESQIRAQLRGDGHGRMAPDRFRSVCELLGLNMGEHRGACGKHGSIHLRDGSRRRKKR